MPVATAIERVTVADSLAVAKGAKPVEISRMAQIKLKGKIKILEPFISAELHRGVIVPRILSVIITLQVVHQVVTPVKLRVKCLFESIQRLHRLC